MREAKEDPGLAEVKAVLQRLQRIDPAAGEDIDQTNLSQDGRVRERTRPPRTQPPADISVFDRKHAAITNPNQEPKRRVSVHLAGAGVAVAAAVILSAAGLIYLRTDSKTGARQAKPAAQEQKQDESALLTEARRLLSEGKVTLAQDRLLRGGPESHADVAFVLAQSYDPNYLQSLPKAGSVPNRSEAERWYKKWYELARQSGLEMDSNRLQRIINAMH